MILGALLLLACVAAHSDEPRIPEVEPAHPGPRVEVQDPPERTERPAPTPPRGLWLYDQQGDLAEDLWGEIDPGLQAQLEALLEPDDMLGQAYREQRLSMVLVDITDPERLQVAMIRPDWEIFTASLSKIAILLGVEQKIHDSGDPAQLAEVQPNLDRMIKASSNEDANFLYRWTGFEPIHEALMAHQLYHPEHGGLWWTPKAEGKPSPKEGHAIAGTARQVARYFLLMEQGRLIDPERSAHIKSVLENAALAVFFRGIRRAEPEARYFGKPGIVGGWVSEGALIEGEHTRYILAGLTEGTDYQNPGFADFGERLHRMMCERHAPR
jgi:beta-lactamase class A